MPHNFQRVCVYSRLLNHDDMPERGESIIFFPLNVCGAVASVAVYQPKIPCEILVFVVDFVNCMRCVRV